MKSKTASVPSPARKIRRSAIGSAAHGPSAPLAASIATLIAGVALLSQSASATTYTWANSSGNWSSGGSWSPTGTPGAADTVMLSTTGTVNVDSTQSILNITTYGAATGNTGMVTGAATLNLANSGTIYAVGGGAYGISLSAPMSLSGSNYTFRSEGGSGFTVNAAGTITSGYTGLTTLNIVGASNNAITINSNVSDGSATGNGGLRLVINNTSGLTLAGTNTFTGGILYNAGGTLKLNNNQSLSSGTLTINALGGKVDTGVNPFTNAATTPQVWNADFIVGASYAMNFGAGAITLGGNRTVSVSGGNAVTYGGAIGDSGSNYSLTFGEVVATGPAATSSVVLTASNTYTGATTLNEGTLTLGGAAGALSGKQVTVNANATLKWDNTTANLSNRLTGSGTLAVNGGYVTNVLYNSGSSNSTFNWGSLVIGGSATAYFTNNPSVASSPFSSTTVFNNLTRSAGSTLQANDAWDPYVYQYGLVVLSNSTATINGVLPWAFNTASGRVGFLTDLLVSNTNYLTTAATVSNFVGNTPADNVQLVTNPATLLVSDTLNALCLVTSSSLNSINLGGNSLVVNSGGLAATGANGLLIQNGTITTGTGSQELIYHAISTTSGTISASITDNGSAVSFTKGSGQPLALSGSNSYSGTTTVAGGALTVSGIVANGPVNVNYSGTGTGSGSLTVSGTTGNGLITVGKGASLTVSATGKTGNGGITLSPGDGTQNVSATINGTVGNGTISVGNADTLTVASTGVVNGPIAFGTNNNNTATLSVASGAALNGAVTSGTNVANTAITQTGAGLASVTIGSGTNYFGNVTPVASSTLALSAQAGGVNTFGTIASAATSTVVFSGAGASTVTTTPGNSGQLVKLTSGTLTLTAGRNIKNNLEIDGGVFVPAGDRFGQSQSGATFLLTGGTVNVPSDTYGVRFGCDSGAGSAQVAVTGSQSGGQYTVTNNAFSIGGNAGGGLVDSYTLTGGTMNILGGGMSLGADTGGASTTTFTLGGGKLIVPASSIAGSQATGAKQYFLFNGGTLVAAAVDMTKLVTSGTVTASVGTLTNNGGALAPGDLGSSGLTTITGNYTQSSGTLAIDLGGTTASGAFQDTGLGKFDKLAITGSASLAGNLSINILPGFAPGSNSFTVLTSSTLSASSGAFQTSTPQFVQTNEGFSSMTATTFLSGSVVLNNYTITNQWQGGAGNWGTGTTANWTGGIDPNGTTQGAYFSGSAAGGTVTIDGTGRTVGTLVFNNAANSYTLAGSSTLTLQGNAGTAVLSNFNGAHAISAPVTLANNLYVAVTNATDKLTISGNIAGGANAIALSGSGTLLLSGTNTFGSLAVNSGTVQAAQIASLPGYATAGAITVSGSGTLAVNAGGTGEFSVGNLTTLLGSATIIAGGLLGIDTTNAGGSLTYSPAIAGNVGLIKLGSGMLVLGGNSTNSGNLTVAAGSVQLGGSGTGTSNPLGLGTVTVASGATLDLAGYTLANAKTLTINGQGVSSVGALTNSSGGATYGAAVTLGSSNAYIGGSGDITIGALAGNYNFYKVGADRLILSASSARGSGTAIVAQGVLQTTANYALGSIGGTGAVNLSGGGVALDVDNTTQSIGSLTGVANSSVWLGSGTLAVGADNSNTVFNGVIGDSGGASANTGGNLTKMGTGTLTLTASNSHTGTTTISSGTLQLGNGGATGSLSGSGTLVDNATLAFNRSNTVTQGTDFGPVISGSGGMVQSGLGTLVLGGSNTNTGGLTINAGLVQLAGTGSATGNPLGMGPVTVNSNATLDLAGYTLASAKTLTINGQGVSSVGALTNSGAAAVYSGTVTMGSNFPTIGGAGDITLSGPLLGNYTFYKTGADTLILSGSSSRNGGSAVLSGGVLQLNNSYAMGTSGVTFFGGSLMVSNSAAATVTSELLTASGTVTINAGASFTMGGLTDSGNTLTFTGSGNVAQSGAWGSGTGAVTFAPSFTGTATLGQTNAFTGALTIKSGYVSGTGNVAAFGGGAIVLGDTGGSANATLSGDGRTFANPITVQAGSSGTLSLVGNGGATAATFSGAVSGSGALTTGGYVALSNANSTYNGNLTVSSGTLKVGGSTAPNMPALATVANGATLDINAANEAVGGLNGIAGSTVTNSGAAKTLTLAGSGTYAYAGAITAATPANMALTVSLGATGVQTLSGVNSYTGATTLNSGKLNVNSATTLGAAASALTINGGTLDNTSGGALTLSNTSAISIGADFAAFSAGSTSTSSLNLGTGPVNLNMSASTPGIASKTITLNGAGTTLTLGGTTTAIGSYANSLLNVNGVGNTLSFNTLSISANAANARFLAFGGSGNVAITGLLTSVSLGSTLDYVGTGTLTLSGTTQSPVNSNGMAVYSGTWKLDESAMTGTQNILLATNTFNVNGGSLTVFGGSQTFAALTAANAGSAITLDEGSGTAANLTVTTFTRNAGSTTLLDLTNSGTGAFVANNLTASTAILGNVVVKNGSTYSFGATNASKAVVASTVGISSLTASTNSSATNYVTNTGDVAYYTSGTLSMNANAHQTNTLVVNTGTTAGVLNLAGNDLTFATNGLLVTGSGNYTIQNGRLGNGTGVEIDIHQYSAGTLTLAANVNNAGSPFVIAGSGNVVLSGSNGGTGAIDIGGSGTTTLQTGFALTNNNAVAISGLAKLDLNGISITTTGPVTNNSVNAGGITNSGALATLGMGNNSQGGPDSNISGYLNLVFNPGANASTFNGSFSNTGNITVNNNGAGGVNLGANYGSNGALSGYGLVNNSGTITNTGTGAGALTITSNIGANVTGIVENSATSFLTLSGVNNAFNGPIILAAGTKLNLGSATALGGNGSATGTGGALTLGGGNTIDNSYGSALVLTTANALNVNGDFTFVGSNNLTFGTGPVTLANGTRTLTLSANTLTLNGPVGDGNQGYGITKFGNGSLTLTGSSSYGGATAFNGGTLTVNGAAGKLANTSAVTISGGAVFNLGDATAGNGLANRINPAALLTLGGTSGAGQTASNNATFTLVNGSTVPNSQSLASVTVTGFSNDTVNGNGTSNNATLTFTGANPYVRNAGGFVNLDDTNLAAINFTNAPSGSANVVNGMLVGAVRKGNDFISAQSGALTNATYGSNAWGDLINTDVSADLPAASGNTNSIRFNNSTLNTVTLTGASVVNSGGILVGSSATNGAVITGGTLEAASAGDLWVYLNGKSLAINSVIGDNSASSLNVGGSGILTLNGANTYTGATTVVGGTLAIGAAGSTSAGSTISVNAGTALTNSGAVNGAIVNVGPVTNNGAINGAVTAYGTVTNNASGFISQPVTLNSGASLSDSGTAAVVTVNTGATATVNSGGIVTGNVTVNRSTTNGAVNLTNNGTVSGTLSLAGPVSGEVWVYGNNAVAGYASLGAGSVTGPVVANGRLDLNGAGAMTLGAISGSGTAGAIYNNSTYNNSGAGNTYTFQGGSSFSMYSLGAGSFGTLAYTGSGAVYLDHYGYSNSSWNSTVNGGTWIIGAASQNNTGAQCGGTTNIVGGASFTVNQYTGYTHGTWNITNGAMAFAGGVSQTNGQAGYYGLNFSVDNSGGGSGSSLTINGGLTLGQAYASTSSTNSLTINNGGTVSLAGALTISSGQNQTVEVNTVSLLGGKLLVNGAIASGAGTGQTNSFKWTGGQLTASSITPGAGFNGGSSSINSTTFTDAGGTLAPGDSGITGKTTVTGNYTISSGTTAIDLGGTTASSAFQDAANSGKFDTIAVTGTASLGGTLAVNVINGTSGTPFALGTSSSFTILTASRTTGTFASGASVSLTNDPFVGTMAVNVTGSSVYLNGYVGNEYTVTGGTTTWGTSGTGNWTSSFDPNGSAYGAKFGTLGGGGAVTLDQDRTVGILILDSTNGYTLSGANTLTLQGSGTANASVLVNSGTHTVATAVTLASGLAITGTNATQLTVSGNVAGGSQNLMLSGGKLILSGNDTYGNTTIASGTLQLGTGGTGGNLGSGAIGDNGLLLFNRTDSLTVATGIAGTGALTQSGAGQLALTGTNSYSGATTVNSGVLVISGGGSLGNGSYAASIVNNGALVFNTSANQTLSGIVSGSGTVTQAGPGTLTLSGNNNFTGNLLINAGTVVDSYTPDLGVGNTVYLGATSGSNSATLSLGGGGLTYPNAINLGTASGSLTLVATTYLYVSGPITGSHDLILNASGNALLYLTGSNSGFTGNVTLYGGLRPATSALSAANTLAVASGAIADLNGNSGLTIAGLNDVSGAGGVVYNSGGVNRTLTLGGSGNYSFGGILTSTELPVVVNLSGAGKQTFTGLNSYDSTTTINGGTLSVTQLANPAPASTTWTTTSGTNVATVASASGLAVGMAIGTAYSGPTFPVGTTIVNISGTTVTLSANATVSGTAAAITFGNANGLGISSNAAGNLTINGGALQFSGSNAGMSSTDRLFTVGLNGATLDASGSVPVSFTNTGDVGFAGTGTHALVLTGTNTGANLLAASIANSGANATSVNKSGPGTWVLSANNTYTGATTVNSGTLQLGNGGATGSIAPASSVIVNGGLTFNRSNTVTQGSDFATTISGSGSVVQAGAGTVVLSGSNSYSGGTTVNSGTLQVANANALGAGDLTVNGGMAQVMQSASISAVNLASGGIVSLAAHSGSTYNVLGVSSLAISGFSSSVASANAAPAALNADTLGATVNIAALAAAGQSQSSAAQASVAIEPASPEAVPEPGALGLLLTGACALLGFRRKHQGGRRA